MVTELLAPLLLRWSTVLSKAVRGQRSVASNAMNLDMSEIIALISLLSMKVLTPRPTVVRFETAGPQVGDVVRRMKIFPLPGKDICLRFLL